MSRTREPRRPDVTTVELVGGPEAISVDLQPSDPRWADTYLVHQRRIRAALPASDIETEHIGSTSVPGLAADLAVDDYLLLRDHLRTDIDDRALYERTKRTLLSQRWDDMNDYADAKTDVILSIKSRARAARGR